MTDSAAYSLNFLHHGAPKYWTVVRPADHPKLELKLHPDVEQAGGRDRRLQYIDGDIVKDYPQAKTSAYRQLRNLPCDFPPRCDQFLTHQPFYIPSTSLDVWKIGYTRVAQYEGEMIITFPFAYYEGYACGPSLAEVAEHKNDRSELFSRAGLYRDCHYDCTGPALPLNFARRTSDVSFATAPKTCLESLIITAEKDISIWEYAAREPVDELAGTPQQRSEAEKKESIGEDIVGQQLKKEFPELDAPKRKVNEKVSTPGLASHIVLGKPMRLPVRGNPSKVRDLCIYDSGIPQISNIVKEEDAITARTGSLAPQGSKDEKISKRRRLVKASELERGARKM